MEKKVKVLLWTIVGIVAAILIGSIILAFTAPAHLLTLWIGLVVGGGLSATWIYRKSIKSILDNFEPLCDCECEKEKEVVEEKVEETKEETIKVEEPKKVEEKKATTKKKRSTSKKK